MTKPGAVPMDYALSVARTVKYLRAAMAAIAKGEGRFSRDPHTHAENTIEDMKAIATGALDGTWEEPEE